MSISYVSECSGFTEAKVEIIRYTWTIKNFSVWHEVMDESVTSAEISGGSGDGTRWRLHLGLNYSPAVTKSFAKLYLSFDGYKKEIRANYKALILNAKSQKVNEMTSGFHVFAKGVKVGFDKFIQMDHLLNDVNGLLINNELTIFCEIRVILDSVIKSDPSNRGKIEIPHCNFSRDFCSLFEDETYSDVTLLVNGCEYKAHRNILAVRSPVFAAMFKHDMKEKLKGIVEISDFDKDVIKEMLRFIYTGKVLNLDKMADGLLVAAKKYNLDRLKAMCEQAIYTRLSIQNALETLITAVQLKNRTIGFIRQHGAAIIKTAAFKTMLKTHPDLISEAF